MARGAGSSQSPIDIDSTSVEYRGDLPAIELRYPARPVAVEVSFVVADGDDTARGSVVVPQLIVEPTDPGAHVVLAGTRFDLQSLHWHTPSEHHVDGVGFPLELHLVHGSSSGDLLVLGVLSHEGPTDDAIEPAFECMAAFGSGDTDRRTAEMRLDALVPSDPGFYRYDGSLTTAPFTEGVSWFVCTSPRSASTDQIEAHRRLVSGRLPGYGDRPQPPGNARSLQDRAGRSVLSDRG